MHQLLCSRYAFKSFVCVHSGSPTWTSTPTLLVANGGQEVMDLSGASVSTRAVAGASGISIHINARLNMHHEYVNLFMMHF